MTVVPDYTAGVNPTLLRAIYEYRETGIFRWPDVSTDDESPAGCDGCHGARLRARYHGRLTEYVECDDCAEESARDRAARLIAKVPLPYRRTFADYEDFVGSSGAGSRGYGAAARSWAMVGEGSILFTGPPGALKTTLASAIYMHRVQFRQPIGGPTDHRVPRTAEWVAQPDLLDEIRASYDHTIGAPTSSEILTRVKTCDLLLLDDLGAATVTSWVQEQMYSLISHRERHVLPTIFTANLSIDQLRHQLGAAITSRIVGMCGGGSRIVVMNPGRDMRYQVAR